jgi:hypothetical protein
MPISRASTGMLIGIDFDNTLVTYDELLREAALARALIDTDFAGTKQEIRDRNRVLPDGAEALLQQPSDDRPRQLHQWFMSGIEADPAQSAKPRSA